MRAIHPGRLALLTAVLLLARAAPAAAAARTVGLIMPQCCDIDQATKDTFLQGLQAAGVPPGDVEILLQRPGVDRVSLVNSIRKMVAYEARALVVFGGTAARETAKEARDIPMVFIGVHDPVGAGLVGSLEKPGKNATGVAYRAPLAFLLDAVQETTELKTLGVLHHSDNLDSQAQLAEARDLAAKRSLTLVAHDLRGSTAAAAVAAMQPTQFVLLAAGCFPDFFSAEALDSLGRPVATQCVNVPVGKVVFHLAPDPAEIMAEAARLVARILKGEKAGQIPCAVARKVGFTVNLQSAQKLGLKIPFTVIGRATKVVR